MKRRKFPAAKLVTQQTAFHVMASTSLQYPGTPSIAHAILQLCGCVGWCHYSCNTRALWMCGLVCTLRGIARCPCSSLTIPYCVVIRSKACGIATHCITTHQESDKIRRTRKKKKKKRIVSSIIIIIIKRVENGGKS